METNDAVYPQNLSVKLIDKSNLKQKREVLTYLPVCSAGITFAEYALVTLLKTYKTTALTGLHI